MAVPVTGENFPLQSTNLRENNFTIKVEDGGMEEREEDKAIKMEEEEPLPPLNHFKSEDEAPTARQVSMDSMEEKLIELVRIHPEIYDTCNPNYMKGKLKQEIWDTIAKELNLSNGEEAKSTWRKLRNNHRDALRRQRRMIRSGAAAQPMKAWKFQDQMQFLLRYMFNENRDTNFTTDDDRPNPLSQDQSAASESQTSADQLVEQLEKSTQPKSTSEEGNSLHSSTSAPPLNSTPSQPKKKAKKIDVDALLINHIEQREQRSKERSEERKKMEERLFPKDDLYLFFMSIYEQTKKMPPASRHIVKKNVFLTVSQEEERLLNISEPPTAPQYQQLYPVYNNDQHINNFPLPSPINSPASSISTSSVPPSTSSPGSMESYLSGTPRPTTPQTAISPEISDGD